ncbi:MAG: ABC transporter permease [Planctomycetes bacterium]|nr:ABC transporter permease [Planctomycetota bacterium]
MSPWRWIRRSLLHHRTAHAASALGVAVATAALTGALLVGDSVRGSLRAQAVGRLGPITHAVTGRRFFPADLADRVEAGGPPLRVHPAVLLRGSAVRGDESGRVGEVHVGAADLVGAAPGRCVLNAPLAELLGVGPGDAILLDLPRPPTAAAGAALVHRDRRHALARLRVTVDRIVEARGFAGDFTLFPTQRAVRRAWVNLADLQAALDERGRVNTLLIAAGSGTPPAVRARPSDDGLRVASAGPGAAALRSDRIYLDRTVEAALPAPIEANRVLVHLVDTAVNTSRPDRPAMHYAVAAGLSRPPGGPLGDDEIAVNRWTADRLAVRVGDRLALHWRSRRADGRVVAAGGDQTVFRVARIVPMEGLGAEPSLTPAYPGLTDAGDIRDWQPPADLPIDLDKVTDADEAYWDAWQAAPKLLVSLATAQRLWAGPDSRLTSVRVAAADAERFEAALGEALTAEAMGLAPRPIRAEHAAAAEPTTDFAQLVLALSFFVIAAAALLTALLMRLAVEQRAGEFGLLAALGFGPARIRRLALGEGLIVAAVGTAAGLVGAVGYSAAIMAGLRTWWIGAVGTAALRLYVSPASMAVGAAAGGGIAAAALLWGIRRVGRAPVAALLAGRWQTDAAAARRRGPGRWMSAVALTAAGMAVAALAAGGRLPPAAGILGGGALLLAAGLAWLGCALAPARRSTARLDGRAALARLAVANAGRRPTRTLLAAGLMAFGAFTVIVVGAFRAGPPADTHDPAGGAGGFALIARLDVPLPASPTTEGARRQAGLANAADPTWGEMTLVNLHRRDGQDVSCLNLTRAAEPAILGVNPHALAGRFTAADTIRPGADPWRLLAERTVGAVPVIADDATARWILHAAVGDTLTIRDGRGATRQIRLVATLAGSIFQGELLMGEADFVELFGASTGPAVLLAAVEPSRAADARAVLAAGLADYGASVEPTAALLGRYAEVTNTYLTTFQSLGALGLLIGTAGLTVVLVRHLLERRAELALLGVLGMTGRRRVMLLAAEGAVALGGGLLVAALAAVAPLAVIDPGGPPLNWGAILATIVGILGLGTAAQATAAALIGRRVRPADLRRE